MKGKTMEDNRFITTGVTLNPDGHWVSNSPHFIATTVADTYSQYVVTGPFDETMEQRPSVFADNSTGRSILPPGPSIGDALTAAREQGAQEERAKIMAKLETCRPTEQPYTRVQWRWEEKGKQELWNKLMKALA
jgi:hypothetical protein